jgi:hypothetical protein
VVGGGRPPGVRAETGCAQDQDDGEQADGTPRGMS